MDISTLAKLLEKLDPGQIKKIFPEKSDEEKFTNARKLAINIIESIRNNSVDIRTFDQLETAASEFRLIYSKFSGKTELASKACMNEAVLWAEVGLLERSIYLAGLAKERKIREPYRTQINSLPAHACCARYRQLEIVLSEIEISPNSIRRNEVLTLLREMRRSYLTQFTFFAGQAYLENPKHPMAAYKQSLACFLKAYELENSGQKAEADALVAAANGALRSLPEPNTESHFMNLQYHEMNFLEFMSFERLSAQHSSARERLQHFSTLSKELKKEGNVRQTQMSFAFAPIVGWGARSASAVGIILSIGPLLGWDNVTIQAAVDSLWNHASHQVPNLAQTFIGPDAAAQSAFNIFGGLAPVELTQISSHTGGLAAHIEGLGTKFASAAAHTGGFA